MQLIIFRDYEATYASWTNCYNYLMTKATYDLPTTKVQCLRPRRDWGKLRGCWGRMFPSGTDGRSPGRVWGCIPWSWK